MNTQDKTLPALSKHCPNCGQQEIRQLADGFKCHECGGEFNDKFIPYTKAGTLKTKADTQDKSTPVLKVYGRTSGYAQIWQDGICIINVDARLSTLKAIEICKAVNQFEALTTVADLCDPDMMDAIANELTGFQHSARCHSMHVMASKIRQALAVLNQIQNAK